jgi:tRNA A37 threonylcarbamoyladenosine biosynthesis protein TsaE
VVIEWADRLADMLPEETLELTLSPGPGGSGREAVLVDRNRRGFAWLPEVPEFHNTV